MSNKKKSLLLVGLFIVGYFFIHLLNPTNLPVFADESIYIRWAQLIIDDWQQYLFFPLNDGKTPIYIWALVPFQFIVKDHLLAGRLLSMVVGLAQAWVMSLLAKQLKLSKKIQILSAVMTVFLPYWFFHHHLALMDGMLTLWLSCSALFTLKIVNQKSSQSIISTNSILAGIFLGLAILTKIPAVLFIPSLLLLLFINNPLKNKYLKNQTTQIIISLFIATSLFFLLKLHPAFGQLFSRGSDFLFPWKEIVFEGKWRETVPSWPTYLHYFGQYLTWPIFIFALIGLILKRKRESLILNLSWLLYALPTMLMGKVVYARYLFSVSIFITLAALLALSQLTKKSLIIRLFVMLMMLLSFYQSTQFIFSLAFHAEKIKFVKSDTVQYLTEWSAGFGVKETVELIKKLGTHQRVLVLSEGYFGTLPDGLLMYLHRQNVDNIYIEPIGQPINNLKKATTPFEMFDQVLLVGNSHRLNLDLSQAELLKEYCRPFDAPCHQIWDITTIIAN